MFDSDNLESPATNFMNRLKQAITHEQFQQITNNMLRGMNIVKQRFCERDHYTLQEAQNQLHALLIDIMMDDARYIIDKIIDESRKEMAQLRKIRNWVDNYKSIVSSKKDNKDKLVKTLEFAKKALTDKLQEELSNPAESAGEEIKDKIREDTIK